MTGEPEQARRVAKAQARQIWRLLRNLRHSLALGFGVDEQHRVDTVIAMLEANARRAPGYWLQLALAACIATLGVVLGSTAVVIGGMLVSPLMGPIVELGMGFAVGSAFLVLRAFLRVLLSVVLVLAAATLITLVLPFHQITAEISSRTAPTVLDLLVAIFCALAAAYTTVRRTADTTAAAAGTAVGIALVPPLCVAGYGLGTASGSIASGASLLFVANFSAILVFAVVSFLALGYDEVDADELERQYLGPQGRRTDRAARRGEAWLKRLFGSRYGPVMRLLVPLLFLAAVYVPLRKALDEVSWQVRVRSAVSRLLDDLAPQAVESTLTAERGTVTLRLLTVDTPTGASRLQRQLETGIAAAAGVTPTVTVIAVPNSAALEHVTAETPGPPPSLTSITSQLEGSLRSLWPAAAAGPLVGWALQIDARGRVTVTTHHVGAPLGASGAALLGQALTSTLGTAPAVIDAPLDTTPIVAASSRTAGWISEVTPRLALAPVLDGAVACIRGPGATDTTDVTVRALRAVPGGDAPQVHYATGRRWSFQWRTSPCEGNPTAP